ncbi:MAG: universal stress protein [Devosia sp.]|nr:universal stress protein [Devosia sp.]
MDIKSVLVSLEPRIAPTTLGAAVDIARRFKASLIGLAAAEPSSVLLEGPAGIYQYSAARTAIEEALALAKADFEARAPRDLVRGFVSTVENPTQALRRESLASDLLIVEARPGLMEYSAHPDIGELVLTTGRPVLALAPTGERFRASNIVIAWKDTREARRAVADALPFLSGADQVLVASVDEGDYTSERGRLDTIVSWLHLHGLPARGEVLPMGQDLASTIHGTATAIGADLIVAGGYGHSRFREWLLGGMTQGLLEQPTVSLLLSN